MPEAHPPELTEFDFSTQVEPITESLTKNGVAAMGQRTHLDSSAGAAIQVNQRLHQDQKVPALALTRPPRIEQARLEDPAAVTGAGISHKTGGRTRRSHKQASRAGAERHGRPQSTSRLAITTQTLGPPEGSSQARRPLGQAPQNDLESTLTRVGTGPATRLLACVWGQLESSQVPQEIRQHQEVCTCQNGAGRLLVCWEHAEAAN